ncbi:MAG: pantoate--beta-alanine ligase [Nitrospiraceae bacterium]|nr:pantoate--beta-alanine ligase [Nitrospiraceae bacterium]
MLQDITSRERRRGRSVGLVPTMGALHAGHMSLIKRARAENDIVVVSIFVNPAQFAAGEDFNKYPRDLASDAGMIQDKADYLFAPEAWALYPSGYNTWVYVEGLSEGKLCGRFRPGHFKGVATIVLKLFNIIQPDRAYFGLKDYQQSVIIRKMASDLDLSVDIVLCPTIREPDGLAMSSRNAYLAPEEREAARALYEALQAGAGLVRSGAGPEKAKTEMQKILSSRPLISEIQYASVYNPETLEELSAIEKTPVLLAGAIRIGNTRLIDNVLVNELK